MKPTDDDRATATRAIIDEILERLQRGEPVTPDLLARIPPGLRVEMSVTVRDDHGTATEQATIVIDDGLVTCYPPGTRPN